MSLGLISTIEELPFYVISNNQQ